MSRESGTDLEGVSHEIAGEVSELDVFLTAAEPQLLNVFDVDRIVVDVGDFGFEGIPGVGDLQGHRVNPDVSLEQLDAFAQNTAETLPRVVKLIALFQFRLFF